MAHLTQQEAINIALNDFIDKYRETTSSDWQTFIKGATAILTLLKDNTIELEEKEDMP